MQIVIDKTQWFGYDATVYDNEKMACIEIHGAGEYRSEYSTPMTAEEMKKWADERYVYYLEKMHLEIKSIQEKYEQEIKKIKEFKKGIDKQT